jgi:hypothetical protein
MKTELQASISIEASAWDRVRSLAARKGRPLPVVIGELLEQASAETEADARKAEPYEAPPLVRLFLRRHPEAQPPED